jgi:hypothetical protein
MAKKGRRATEDERIQAVQLIETDRKIDDVADIMGVGRRHGSRVVGEIPDTAAWRNYRRNSHRDDRRVV